MANRYFIQAISSNWSDTANWSDTLNGTGGFSVPTSADDVFIGGSYGEFPTITIDTTSYCKSLTTTSSFYGANTFLEGSSVLYVYGDFNIDYLSVNYTGTIIFLNSGSASITTNGISLLSQIQFSGTGTITLQDNLTTSTSKYIYILAGTLNTNNFNVTAYGLLTSGASAKTLTLGSSTINVRFWGMSNGVVTLNAGTSTINLTTTTQLYFVGPSSGHTYYNVNLTLGSSNISYIVGENTFTNLTITNTSEKTSGLGLYNNQTITGTFTVTGNTILNRPLIYSWYIGTPVTITAANTSLTNADFMDITGAGAAAWTGTSIGNALGNSGITFTTPVTRYGVVGSDWTSTGTWSTTSGGSAGASVPLCHDDVILNASSGAGTYRTDQIRACANLTCTGFTGTLNLTPRGTSDTVSFYGNIILPSGGTVTLSSTSGHIFYLRGRGSHTITSGGRDFPYKLVILAPGGTYTLQDSFTTANTANGYLSLEGGTFDTNNFNTNVRYFKSGSDNIAKTLYLRSGTMTINSTAACWRSYTSLTLDAGTSTIILQDDSSSTKGFYPSDNKTFYNLTLSSTVSCTYEILDNGYVVTFNNLEVSSAVAQTLEFYSQSWVYVASFITNASGSGRTTIDTSYAGAAFNLVKTGGGKVSEDYLNIQHCVATPSLTWYAGANSTNNQAVVAAGSGWAFHAPDFTNPGNIYSSNNVYTTCPATSGVLHAQISVDGGLDWSSPLYVTLTGSESTLTFGLGSTETWGKTLTRADMVDANFRVRLYHDDYQQTYKTFGFTTGTDIITGIEITIEGSYATSTISLDHLRAKIYYGTSIIPVQQGSMAYASNGRKNGEGAGAGTGVLVYYDDTNWIAADTGSTVAA